MADRLTAEHYAAQAVAKCLQVVLAARVAARTPVAGGSRSGRWVSGGAGGGGPAAARRAHASARAGGDAALHFAPRAPRGEPAPPPTHQRRCAAPPAPLHSFCWSSMRSRAWPSSWRRGVATFTRRCCSRWAPRRAVPAAVVPAAHVRTLLGRLPRARPAPPSPAPPRPCPQVFASRPEGETLLERWSLRYGALPPGAAAPGSGARAGGSDDAAVYKRMVRPYNAAAGWQQRAGQQQPPAGLLPRATCC